MLSFHVRNIWLEYNPLLESFIACQHVINAKYELPLSAFLGKTGFYLHTSTGDGDPFECSHKVIFQPFELLIIYINE